MDRTCEKYDTFLVKFETSSWTVSFCYPYTLKLRIKISLKYKILLPVPFPRLKRVVKEGSIRTFQELENF